MTETGAAARQPRTIRVLPVQGASPTLDDSLDLRSLIPHAEDVQVPIRYSDNVWDFTGYPLVNQTARSIDFTGVPPRWRFAVKDWVLLRMNPELARDGASGLDTGDVMATAAAAERPIRLPSVIAYVYGLTVSLTVLDDMGKERLAPKDWHTFAADLRRALPAAGPASLAGYARPLLSFWSYRGLLGIPHMFGGRPFAGRTPEQQFTVPERGLNAERPNAELCGPLLGLALWMLDHCAEDVLFRMETLAQIPDHTGEPVEQQVEHVADVLLRWEQTGRPLPGQQRNRGVGFAPAWAVFVKLAGCSGQVMKNPRGRAGKEFLRLADKLGVSTAEDGFARPITVVPGPDEAPVPWIDGLPPTKFGLGLDHWACTLAYACALIITMLTTVRDRELAALPHDCLRPGTYDRGDMDIPVMRMHGYLVKNKMHPVPATWVVADDVVRAVNVLHRLKAALGLQPKLHPRTGREVLMHPDLGRGRGLDKATDTLELTTQWLRWFQASGNHLTERGLVPALPTLPPWLSHRVLRITGIEAYASQAWGDALAAAQAHWSSRTVAEGYVGHLPKSVYIADPDSIEEVLDQERAHALLDIAADLEDDPDALAGNGVLRAKNLLADTGAYELATGPVTARQLNVLAKKSANVYVGELTVCVHGPGGLCGNESEAEWLLCRPFACRNSAMTRAQRARLEVRRRTWARRGGVFDRARRKIEADAPTLEAEFADDDDAVLRELILSDLPRRYARAAKGASDE